MITKKIKQFYRLFGQDENHALRNFQRYFPEPYTLNEITHDTAEDFVSHNEVANQALLIGVEIGKAVAFQKRQVLLNAKYSTKMGTFAQKKIGHLPQEQLCLALLDAQLNVIGWETVFVGTVSHVQASPREIFQRVLKANAVGFMIVHNHPSGYVMPSKADIVFSQRLATLGQQMDIHLFDSFVVTHSDYWSMSEKKQLKKLSRSNQG